MEQPSTRCDVVVIGGGPAGSAISALLAEKGWQVEILEKDRHPRFHIGESLLPYTLPLLERLGVLDEVEKIGLKKYGAELISPYHDKVHTLYFSGALDKSYPYAFQVRRSEFDQILLNNSIKKGVRVHEGVTATHADFSEGQLVTVRAVDQKGNDVYWQPRFLVDATGRETFLSTQFRSKQRNAKHNSAAIFSHFEGVERHSGTDEGNITICWFDYGWFWIIPFKDGVTSVGAVCWPSYLKSRKTELDQFLWDTIEHCVPMARRLKHAKMVLPAMATGNYSYQADTMSGDRYIVIGDAFAFVDPVFSTGVHLALHSAQLGANVVDSYLNGAVDFARLAGEFEKKVRQGLSTYTWFIYRFTQPAFRNLFIAPRNWFKMEETILSILAGDVFKARSRRFPILLFKLIYYLSTALAPRFNLANYRIRQDSAEERKNSHLLDL